MPQMRAAITQTGVQAAIDGPAARKAVISLFRPMSIIMKLAASEVEIGAMGEIRGWQARKYVIVTVAGTFFPKSPRSSKTSLSRKSIAKAIRRRREVEADEVAQ